MRLCHSHHTDILADGGGASLCQGSHSLPLEDWFDCMPAVDKSHVHILNISHYQCSYPEHFGIISHYHPVFRLFPQIGANHSVVQP